MTNRRTLLVFPLLAATAFSVGCGDSGSGSPTGPTGGSGSVSFTSTGGVAGSFSASGSVQIGANQQPQFGTWAAGAREGSELNVVAFRGRTAPRGDAFGLYVDGVTGPRTFQVSDDCEANCAEVVFLTNADVFGTSQTFDRFCFLVSGSVSINSISAQQTQGSFSGQGLCFDMSFREEPFAITNGSFNVPIVQGIGTGF
jgi:hypothetical protein